MRQPETTHPQSIPRFVGIATATLAAVAMLLPPTVGAVGVPGTATQDINVSGCDFTATYTWSGFGGGPVMAHIQIVETPQGGPGFIAAEQTFPVGNGSSGTETLSLTLVSSATTSSFDAGGLLLTPGGHRLPGSIAESSVVSASCA